MSRALRFYVIVALLLPSPLFANDVVSESTNWRDQALTSLTYRGSPLSFNEQGSFNQTSRVPLCVRLNNYGCVKQGSDPWNGSNGQRDNKGHAVFDDPAYSVRAVVRDYCSKHRRGLRSAVALANAYSPWCDTLGSLPVYKGWGRSCGDSPYPPANFDGPLCNEPSSEPSEAQCASCNCPSKIAGFWLTGIDSPLDPYDDLQLFDNEGAPNNDVLPTLLRNKMKIELGGFEPTDDVIERGISLAGTCR